MTKKELRLILSEVQELILTILSELRYNIAPTQQAPVIVQENGRVFVRSMRWGLQPSWSKAPLINLQSETIAEKPAFKESLRQRRCLVPADSFYEWASDKQPMRFLLKSGEPFCFAGIWENGLDAGGQVVPCFTILTTGAAPSVVTVHERMPLLVQPPYLKSWLDANDVGFEKAIRDPFTDWRSYPVNEYINKAGHEGPGCIEPPHQPSLFPVG